MKKGDLESLNNYRLITLLSQIYKTFTRIILNRIVRDLDMVMSREQAGFRSGYSTLECFNDDIKDHIVDNDLRVVLVKGTPDTEKEIQKDAAIHA
ncbi:hypothetical protein TELCIR_10139 [Teladorsagia circumcincta]|uniref:Uncharacterized protein n=1 Tax=Teladorsagia circumcincta TaxID=45464 RepID=A0A2G9UCW6_TELCI|nr:hypothetical protein TELCIR_10139 [Teladorsagia circumcincta]